MTVLQYHCSFCTLSSISEKEYLSTRIFENLIFLLSGVEGRSLPLPWAQKKELILSALNTESG